MRDHLQQVMFALVEEISHVLDNRLESGEIDFILCYDVLDLPIIARTALLQDDLVLVTQAASRSGTPVSLVDALDETLVMPEEGDSVRTAMLKSANDLGLDLKVTFEIRSTSAMRALAAGGVASAILPNASVNEEVQNGMPSIKRTLYLATSRNRSPLAEAGLSGAVRASLSSLIEVVGPLCSPLWTPTP